MTVGELDQHSGAEGQECFGRVFVEDWLGFVEGPVRSNWGVECGLGRVVELVSDEGLEVEDQGGTEAVRESSEGGDSFVVDDLRDTLHLVAVHVGGRVGDAASEESERGREGLADGLGVGAEGLDLVSSCIVDGDELCHAGQDSLVGL